MFTLHVYLGKRRDEEEEERKARAPSEEAMTSRLLGSWAEHGWTGRNQGNKWSEKCKPQLNGVPDGSQGVSHGARGSHKVPQKIGDWSRYLGATVISRIPYSNRRASKPKPHEIFLYCFVSPTIQGLATATILSLYKKALVHFSAITTCNYFLGPCERGCVISILKLTCDTLFLI